MPAPLPERVWSLVSDTTSQFFADKCPRLAAALAYYSVVALPPLLVVTIAVGSLAVGSTAAREAIVAQLASLVGPEGAKLAEQALDAAAAPGASTFAPVAGTVVLLVGATGVFAELQGALNTVWGLQAPSGKPILRILRERLLSLAMVMVLGFLLLVSLALSAALAAWPRTLPGAWSALLPALHFVASVAAVTALVATIYKVLPDARIRWREVWLGALITAILLELGKSLIGLYLGRSSFGSAYGAAGALAALLAWVYYAGLIFFWGAEFTEVFASRDGHVEARRGALRVEPRRVTQRSPRRPAKRPKA